MLFSSLSFIWAFLPTTLLFYYLLSKTSFGAAKVWLCAASFFFYTHSDIGLSWVLLVSMFFNLGCAHFIGHPKISDRSKGSCLAFAILTNLILLFYFKYLPPLFESLRLYTLLPTETTSRSVLPLGISFFTFTQIGYLIDLKNRMVSRSGPVNYFLFVTFFPHLIAGPIIHHKDVMSQFENSRSYRLDENRLPVGLTIFAIGLFKKIVLADQLVDYVNLSFQNPNSLPFIDAWLGALTFSLQLYFDFSGYSDMAVGLGWMFGIKLPINFNSPFKAKSIIDFWQRWHISLTRYIGRYLYTPIATVISRRYSDFPIDTLGGFLITVTGPTILTMILVGLWHSAGWQYLVFGLFHGIALTINHAYRTWFSRNKVLSGFLNAQVSVAITFITVIFSQVMFRANSHADSMSFYRGMMGINGFIGRTPELQYIALLILLLTIVFAFPNTQEIMGKYNPSLGLRKLNAPTKVKWGPSWVWTATTAVLFGLALISIKRDQVFIYFHF